MIFSRRTRHCGLALFIVSAFAINAAPTPEPVHPIEQLLRRHAGAMPSIASIRAAGKHAGARIVLERLLTSVKDEDLWASAIEALGVITDLKTREGSEVFAKLNAFLHYTDPFGCLQLPCPKLNADDETADRDREARLVVPIAIGYLLQNSETSSASASSSAAQDILEAMDTLEQVAKTPYITLKAQWCRDSAGKIDESCGVELQVNAVRGLKLIGSSAAKQSLQRVAKEGKSDLVIQEAKNALGESALITR